MCKCIENQQKLILSLGLGKTKIWKEGKRNKDTNKRISISFWTKGMEILVAAIVSAKTERKACSIPVLYISIAEWGGKWRLEIRARRNSWRQRFGTHLPLSRTQLNLTEDFGTMQLGKKCGGSKILIILSCWRPQWNSTVTTASIEPCRQKIVGWALSEDIDRPKTRNESLVGWHCRTRGAIGNGFIFHFWQRGTDDSNKMTNCLLSKKITRCYCSTQRELLDNACCGEAFSKTIKAMNGCI